MVYSYPKTVNPYLLYKYDPDTGKSRPIIPIIGPWSAKVGRVINILSSPCEGSPWLAVQAMWHATPYLIWSFAKPDPVDESYDRFGQHHHKKRRANMKVDGYQVPELSIPEGLGWAMFKLAGDWLQHAGFYFSVVDAGLDWTIYWSSLAYQWSGCPSGGTPYVTSKLINDVTAYAGADPTQIGFWQVQSEQIFYGDGNSVDSPQGYNASVFAHMVGKPGPASLGPPCTDWTFELREANSSTPIKADPLTVTPDGYKVGAIHHDPAWSEGSMIFDGKNNTYKSPGQSWSVWLTKGPGVLDLSGSQLGLYGSKDPGLTFDP